MSDKKLLSADQVRQLIEKHATALLELASHQKAGVAADIYGAILGEAAVRIESDILTPRAFAMIAHQRAEQLIHEFAAALPLPATGPGGQHE